MTTTAGVQIARPDNAPPHLFERELVALALVEPIRFEAVAWLEPQAFTDPKLQLVFGAQRALFRTGHLPHVVAVRQAMEDLPSPNPTASALDYIGGAPQLYRLHNLTSELDDGVDVGERLTELGLQLDRAHRRRPL